MYTHVHVRRWFFSVLVLVFFLLSLPAHVNGQHAEETTVDAVVTPVAPTVTPTARGRNGTIPPINNGPTWTLSTPPLAPSARAEMGFVYDTHHNRILSIGGSADGHRLEDLWQYSDAAWAQHASAQTPGGRDRPAVAYDPVRRVVVLFGGSSPDDGTFYNDTWEYDGETWVRKYPQNPPSPRNGAKMAYDPIRGTMVLFGGYRWLGTMNFYNETWEYAGGEWIKRSPAAAPPPRETAGLAFDSDRGVMVLFGGGRYAGSTVYADTWEWDGYIWVQRTLPAAPPARWAHAMTYDQTRRRIVLNGGLTGLSDAFNDTWTYDGVTWTEVTGEPAPPDRWDHGMVYDAANDEIVLFGGMYAGAEGFAWRNDTWIYRAPPVAAPRPVVFLPDFAGSTLKGRDPAPTACATMTDKEVWPNLPSLLHENADNPLGHLSLNEDGITAAEPCDEITSAGLAATLRVPAGESEIEIQRFYERLTEHLQATTPAVIACHYDWRRSSDGGFDTQRSDPYSLFDRVRQCVLAAQNGNPDLQVDIVAHGTGGLVAQGYLLNGGAEDVHTVIALGTPYMGTVTSFLTLRYGHMFLPGLDPSVPKPHVVDLAANWPALYQSLATSDFLTGVGGYFYQQQVGEVDYTALSDPGALNTFLAEQFNAGLVEAAGRFQAGLGETSNLQDIRYFFFAGNNIDTPRWLFEKTLQRWGNDESVLVYDVIPTRSGDGIVPLESATLPTQAAELGATVCIYNKVAHWELAGHPEVLRDLSNALLGLPLSAARCEDRSDTSRARSLAATQTDPSRQLIIDGGHAVHIWDDQGRHAGPVAGAAVLENEIPQLTYWLGDERAFISLPAENTYTVTLLLTDTFASEMKIRTLVPGYSPHSSVQETVMIQDLPTQAGGKATLLYDPLAAPDAYTVAVDSNDDGTVDSVIVPSAVLDQQLSTDRQPPQSTIQLLGQMDSSGLYSGDVVVSLSAQDSGAGVHQILYSLDSGSSSQVYTAPFHIIAEQVPVLFVRAVDRAGNIESPWIEQRVSPEQMPVADITLTAEPPQLQVGDSQTGTISASVTDAAGRPLPGVTLALSTTLGLISSAPPTDASGTTSATLSVGSTPGTAVITAIADTVTATTTVTFFDNSSDFVSITGADVATAGNHHVFLAEVTDGTRQATSLGETSDSWTFHFAATDLAPVFHTVQTPATTTTFNWQRPGPKIVTVTVTTTNQVFSATHPVVVYPDIPSRIALTVGNATMHEDGSRTYPLKAVVTDHLGNLLPNVFVRFGTTLGEIAVSSPTDSAGLALAQLTVETRYGSVTVTAGAGIAETSANIFLGSAPVQPLESLFLPYVER